MSLPAAQEDELATTNLTGGTSPYSAIVLPRETGLFRPFYSFKGGRPGPEDGELAAKLKEWKSCFLSLMRKVGGVGSPGGLTEQRGLGFRFRLAPSLPFPPNPIF